EFVVEDLTLFAPNGTRLLNDVSFSIRAGEVLCVAGVQGNGQTELAEAIVGLQHKLAGSVRLNGTELVGKSVRHVLDAGVGFVPEDRKVEGLVAEFTVSENLMLDRSGRGPFAGPWGIDFAALDEFSRRMIEEVDIRTRSPQSPEGRLSGGNHQKVVQAREPARHLKLLWA